MSVEGEGSSSNQPTEPSATTLERDEELSPEEILRLRSAHSHRFRRDTDAQIRLPSLGFIPRPQAKVPQIPKSVGVDGMEAARLGSEAISKGDFPLAVSHLTKAITLNPKAPDYYIKRSTANTRLSPPEYQTALADAEIAVVLALLRGNRELIAKAQLRRGISLFGLERWADADKCFQWVEAMMPKGGPIPKEPSLGIWIAKVSTKMASLPVGDPRGEVSVIETPGVDIESLGASKSSESTEITINTSETEGGTVEGMVECEAEGKGKGKAKVNTKEVQAQIQRQDATDKAFGEAQAQTRNDKATGEAQAENLTTAVSNPAGAQTPANKIRHEWYQSATEITITLLAKGIPKDMTTVELQLRSLTIAFPLSNGSDFDFSRDPLFAEIDNASSTYKIMSTKIEIILKKAIPGQKWPSLEGVDSEDKDGQVDKSTEDSSAKFSAPAYPTSSKTGPKDWDKLADDLIKKPVANPEASSSKQDGSHDADGRASSADASEGKNEFADDGEDGGDPAHSFFKHIFKNADPDTKRAMMKSFQESNGTALSTNWAEVGKGKVETSPPDGMVAKKWDE